MTYKNLLEIKNLSVIYNSDEEIIKAVDEISIEVEAGENLGIIGESGSGKSSLALSIMGLLDDAKISGEIIYKNTDLLKVSQKKLQQYRWQKIAVVFQNSLEVLNPVITIKKQIEEAVKKHTKLRKKEIVRRIDQLMQMVGLQLECQDYYPHQLSGGMRQRVLIAMALACEPELLLIDEPTASLDIESKKQIIKLLKELQKNNDFTSIVISHDMDTIKELTNRLLTMYEGRFVELGITDEVLKNPSHCYTRGLLNSSPELYPYKDLWGIKNVCDNNSSSDGCAFYPRCPQRSEECREQKPELRYIGLERMVACNRGGILCYLEARNINKRYKLNDGSFIEAVKDADLSIRSGEVAALVGKSGSGKSTLAHLLAGVLEADSGQIKFMDKEIHDSWATSMMQGMQIVFQDPFSATSDRLSVLEVIKEPLDIIGWKDQEARQEKAVDLLRKVNLPIRKSFLKRICRNLSGGQRQRIAVARALITEPRLLIADEITSMLDPSIQANIIRMLKGLQNSEGFSMLYITHNLSLARKIADKVYYMTEGEIADKDISAEQTFDLTESIG